MTKILQMKLNSIHSNPQPKIILKNYMRQLSDLLYANALIEGKRVIVTTEIIDDDDDDSFKITKQAKNEFIEKAKQIGEFSNSEWVEQIINGLKQVGVQGCLPLADEDRPVTNGEIRQLIGLVINLIKEERGNSLSQLASENHAPKTPIDRATPSAASNEPSASWRVRQRSTPTRSRPYGGRQRGTPTPARAPRRPLGRSNGPWRPARS